MRGFCFSAGASKKKGSVLDKYVHTLKGIKEEQFQGSALVRFIAESLHVAGSAPLKLTNYAKSSQLDDKKKKKNGEKKIKILVLVGAIFHMQTELAVSPCVQSLC